MKDFKKFILRGNVIDLAVGVVIGAAFNSIVNALVSDVLSPFISAIVKIPDFSWLDFTLNNSKFLFGHFINSLISFLLTSAAVFFFFIKPINKLTRNHIGIKEDTQKCKECLSDIPLKATRCKFCTIKL